MIEERKGKALEAWDELREAWVLSWRSGEGEEVDRVEKGRIWNTMKEWGDRS